MALFIFPLELRFKGILMRISMHRKDGDNHKLLAGMGFYWHNLPMPDFLRETDLFVQELKRHFADKLVSVVLFGSVARGEARADSDVDLLVVIKKLPEGRYIRRSVLEPVFDKMMKKGMTTPFNCHLKTPEEAQKITVMYYDLVSDAKILYDNNDFFKKIIERVRQHIQKTGAVKHRWGKFYYWDLKPGAHANDTFDIL